MRTPGQIPDAPDSALKQKVELRIGKRGALRFISHHDMLRLLERSMRRAGLPLRYSAGFNPRPRIVLPVPLEVGVESVDEPVELELAGWLPTTDIKERLAASLPADILLYSVRLLPPRRQSQPPLETVYEAHLARAGLPLAEEAVAAFMAHETIAWSRERPDGQVRLDMRKAVLALELADGVLTMRLKPGKGAVRPFEVLEYLLGSRRQALSVPVVRTKTLLAPVEMAGRPLPKRRRK